LRDERRADEGDEDGCEETIHDAASITTKDRKITERTITTRRFVPNLKATNAAEGMPRRGRDSHAGKLSSLIL
jgi:hypothetical protein